MSDSDDTTLRVQDEQVSTPHDLQGRYPSLNDISAVDDERKIAAFSSVLDDLRGRLDQDER
jgi:hypothetical protein